MEMNQSITQETFTLVYHFVILIFLIGFAESVEEFIEKTIDKFIPEWVGYLIIFGIGYFVAWNGDWKFLTFFGYEGVREYSHYFDYAIVAGIIVAGSDKLTKKFGLIRDIPTNIANMKIRRDK